MIGEPDAILLVEFAGDDAATELSTRLERLVELLGDLGLRDAVVRMTDAKAQKELWEVRKAGLNIMMSMKGDGKPVSFIEDCAVPLEHLAEYTERLSEVFRKHGTTGTWYAHASVGTLHVRPILDMRRQGAAQMRAIAEEASAMVREYKGAYSGEHGDGLCRGEWVAWQFGPRLNSAFAEIKALFDPDQSHESRQDRRAAEDGRRVAVPLFRPRYRRVAFAPKLDWSAWNVERDPLTGAERRRRVPVATPPHGLAKAVEMCNNNGHCRKFDAGTMCPSYRVTRDEQHTTRGRANTLRLAALRPARWRGPCGRRRARGARPVRVVQGLQAANVRPASTWPSSRSRPSPRAPSATASRLRDRLIAYLPRYAPTLSRVPWLPALRDRIPGAARARRALARHLGAARAAALARRFPAPAHAVAAADRVARRQGSAAVRRYLHQLLRARKRARGDARARSRRLHRARQRRGRRASAVLRHGRFFPRDWSTKPRPRRGARSMRCCRWCGVASRSSAWSRRACSVCATNSSTTVSATTRNCWRPTPCCSRSSWCAKRPRADSRSRSSTARRPRRIVHGHCHQKAFAAIKPMAEVLGWIPGLSARLIESSCCGMAGAFGYEARHYDVSMAMGELALLPAVRAAPPRALVIADGFSCRHQIRDGAGRDAHARRARARTRARLTAMTKLRVRRLSAMRQAGRMEAAESVPSVLFRALQDDRPRRVGRPSRYRVPVDGRSRRSGAQPNRRDGDSSRPDHAARRSATPCAPCACAIVEIVAREPAERVHRQRRVRAPARRSAPSPAARASGCDGVRLTGPSTTKSTPELARAREFGRVVARRGAQHVVGSRARRRAARAASSARRRSQAAARRVRVAVDQARARRADRARRNRRSREGCSRRRCGQRLLAQLDQPQSAARARLRARCEECVIARAPPPSKSP